MANHSSARTTYAYCAIIDGQPIGQGRVTLPASTSPDNATLVVIGAIEEQIDRRIISDIHQLPGSTVNIGLRQLPTT